MATTIFPPKACQPQGGIFRHHYMKARPKRSTFTNLRNHGSDGARRLPCGGGNSIIGDEWETSMGKYLDAQKATLNATI